MQEMASAAIVKSQVIKGGRVNPRNEGDTMMFFYNDGTVSFIKNVAGIASSTMMYQKYAKISGGIPEPANRQYKYNVLHEIFDICVYINVCYHVSASIILHLPRTNVWYHVPVAASWEAIPCKGMVALCACWGNCAPWLTQLKQLRLLPLRARSNGQSDLRLVRP